MIKTSALRHIWDQLANFDQLQYYTEAPVDQDTLLWVACNITTQDERRDQIWEMLNQDEQMQLANNFQDQSIDHSSANGAEHDNPRTCNSSSEDEDSGAAMVSPAADHTPPNYGLILSSHAIQPPRTSEAEFTAAIKQYKENIISNLDKFVAEHEAMFQKLHANMSVHSYFL